MKPGSPTAPIPFTKYDIALHRILDRKGKDLTWWRELSEEDRYEYLAHDYYRQEWVRAMIQPLQDKINAHKPISDAGAYYALLLEQL